MRVSWSASPTGFGGCLPTWWSEARPTTAPAAVTFRSSFIPTCPSKGSHERSVPPGSTSSWWTIVTTLPQSEDLPPKRTRPWLARVDFLIEQGLVDRQRNGHILFARNLEATLRALDIETAAKSISAETGLEHRPVADGTAVSGIYRRSVMLASGRFALLSDGMGFSLVPWRPVIEKSLGRTITATIRGDGVSWQLGRQRGLSI